jgi:hypothetical protein
MDEVKHLSIVFQRGRSGTPKHAGSLVWTVKVCPKLGYSLVVHHHVPHLDLPQVHGVFAKAGWPFWVSIQGPLRPKCWPYFGVGMPLAAKNHRLHIL